MKDFADKYRHFKRKCWDAVAHAPTVLPFLFFQVANVVMLPKHLQLLSSDFPHQQLVISHTWKPRYTEDNIAILKPFNVDTF